MQKRLIILGITAVVVIMIIVTMWYFQQQTPRLAYVRSYDLIEKYQGTVDARSGFEKKKNSMMANVDSLKMNFERARIQYLNRAGQLSVVQRQNQEQLLGQQQNQLMQYSEAIDQKIEEEDSKMMQEVLNQVNSFVEEYARENNFDFVLGYNTLW